MKKKVSTQKIKKILAMSLIGITSLLITIGLGQAAAVYANQQPKMPWPAGTTPPRITQTMHSGHERAIDIGLRAGTPILAPEDVVVTWHCRARGTVNHRAIKLRNSRNQEYVLIHVSTDNVQASYQQGEQIGTVAADYPNDPSCAISRGHHLHMRVPETRSGRFTIDGQTLSPSTPLYTRLFSTNQPSNSNDETMLELRAVPPNGDKYCLEVNGTKIGILSNANAAKVGRCRSIQEQQFKLR